MKYLKIFEIYNRSYYFNPEHVKKFCEDNLAYLLDAEFVINTNFNLTNIHISIKKGSEGFKWNDIKYDFIPFLELLNNKYKIQFGDNFLDFSNIIKFTDLDWKGYYFDIKELIEDDIKSFPFFQESRYISIDILIYEK